MATINEKRRKVRIRQHRGSSVLRVFAVAVALASFVSNIGLPVLVSAWTPTATSNACTNANAYRYKNNDTHGPRIGRTIAQQCLNHPSATSLRAEPSTSGSSADTDEKDDRISETDARVLQSMLRDNKLDLEQTSNMKKLLERGVRKDADDDDDGETKDAKSKKETEEETYSSQVIQTLADTKFWKAFKRNAGEILESVAISVTNEIEKGAKVLVGLGFFAWDRAKQDVARALPTAASVPKKQVFQLGESSSYTEPVEAGGEEENDELTPSQKAKNLRQEFTTPADELSAVTAEIGNIFKRADRQMALRQQQVDKSRDARNPFFVAFAEEREQQQLTTSDEAGSSPFFASSLSTTASRGSGRLDAAFKRSQKTKLAREKENLAVKGNRLASAAIDSAYQVRQEIESEQNVPGYKTKQLRESTVDVSKRIAGAAKGAAGLLGGASSFLLGGKKDDPQQMQLPPEAPENTAAPKADPVEFLDDASYFAYQREEEAAAAGGQPPRGIVSQQEDLSGGIVIEDNKIIDTEKDSNSGGGPFGFLSAITNRGRGRSPEVPSPDPAEASSFSEPETPVVPTQSAEVVTAEVVTDTKDNFNYYGNDDDGTKDKSKDFFTTNGYLDSMEASTAAASVTTAPSSSSTDDGLRQVTAEVISDVDFDESVFAQATSVDNMSAEELLAQQEAEAAAEAAAEPNFVTKATLRTLDVAFLVVEKGVSVAPGAFELAKRAAVRATEAKLKDSAGSRVGWEFHNGNVRGEKRY